MNRQTLEDMAILSTLAWLIFLFIAIITDGTVIFVISAIFALIAIVSASGVLWDELKE